MPESRFKRLVSAVWVMCGYALSGLRVSPLLVGVLAGVGLFPVASSRLSSQSRPILPRYFTPIGELLLDEDRSVMNVNPNVTMDHNGQYLVIDTREAQGRIYSSKGRLVRHFGRRGQGPGDFQRPISINRLSSGEILVADLSRRLVIFDSVGQQAILTATVPIMPLYKSLPISSEDVLLAGPPAPAPRGSRAPLLHIWNRGLQRIERSFFPTPGDSIVQLAARNFGAVSMAVRGDTIAAVFAFSDTVYLFGRNGEERGKVPLPLTAFLRIQSYQPAELSNPVKRTAWLNGLNFMTDIHWLSDGSFLVQYERPRNAESEWNLVWATRSGERIVEAQNSPKLLTVNRDIAVFIHPDSEAPNRWLLVRLNSQR